MTELENRIIVELSKKVVDNIARKYERIRKGVEGIMGGKVIETEAKKMYNRGISEGILLGEENGRSEGIIGAIGILKDLNMSESEIKKQIIGICKDLEDHLANVNPPCNVKYIFLHYTGGILVKKCFNNYLFTVSYNSFSSVSISFIHILTDASLGIRQSPRGERATLPTFGPSGRHERLNCCAKKRQ